jgi:hypothetical protein
MTAGILFRLDINLSREYAAALPYKNQLPPGNNTNEDNTKL